MKSQKPFTSTTFSRRVDHDAGTHRTSRAPSEPARCSGCGATYSDRRWTLARAPKRAKHKKYARLVTITVCPACKKKQQSLPSGFLYVFGKFLALHRQEIERLLDNEASRAAVDNPTARVMRRDIDQKGRLVTATTTEHLAQRLGHALEKAYGGDVRYSFSHENKLARVYWQRD